ncbi:FliA/WhiG family RNA polymerase sigma factor [Acidithiobacillus marinus]|uniref:FliA/WhiG family RNA polymerase sigma factor n=1 Tax=Acidithiobacillus marinus TaxID=187490 RepID=A0A2I1DN13_9PROT|nr:RNA polymerase sigma factor FliA [Acidithiobacillus marinus]PKY11270.1 FliA/WhiG family RNA polymerase sigma factor [Acidithiobacillus marinus]
MSARRAADPSVEMSAAVARFSPLVERIAQRIRARLPANIDLADLIQAGLIGLMDALSGQENSTDQAFVAYASMRIRGSILDELRNQDWLPRRARAKEQSIRKAIGCLEQQLGRPPEEEEIASKLGWDLKTYQSALQNTGGQIVYLEDLSSENETFAGRFLRDPAADMASILSSEEFARDLQSHIRHLPEREQLVLALYYQDELTLKEIGEVLDVTESRISQIMRQAILRLRSQLGDWNDAP